MLPLNKKEIAIGGQSHVHVSSWCLTIQASTRQEQSGRMSKGWFQHLGWQRVVGEGLLCPQLNLVIDTKGHHAPKR